jgi:glycosyltransferase involved in cell wall biosynthesis
MEKTVVSVVIPTRNRPEIVCRAVRSALDQTFRNLEVIVVIDGPDPATCVALAGIDDPRLRVIHLTESAGGSSTRNIGAEAASGEWIALLDDDDEWFPEKIEIQFAEASRANDSRLIIACQYLSRFNHGDMVRPTAFPRPNQPISEYLYCRTPWLRPQEGCIQTSTLLIPRKLLLEVPFTPGLRRNQDADWLLRAVPASGQPIHVVPRTLGIFHNEKAPGRINSNLDWRYSHDWAVRNRSLFTRKAIAFYFATYCLHTAMRQNAGLWAAGRLFLSCFAYGHLSPKVLWFFLRHAFLTPVIQPLLSSHAHMYVQLRMNR